MGLTLSTQSSADAPSPAEYLDKLRTLGAVSLFVTHNVQLTSCVP